MGKKKDQINTQTKEDPVSQLKTTLSSLSQRVGKMGSILGVEPTNTPQNGHDESPVEKVTKKMEQMELSNINDNPETNSQYERPDMTQEEKKAQRAAKAAEKKARAETAAAKKSGAAPSATTTDTPQQTTASAKNEFERPDMSQEDKKAQRAAKAAEKKKRAEEAAAKKAAGGSAEPSASKKKEEKEQKSAERPSEIVSNGVIPNSDKPCPKSALKTLKSDREEKEVKFDMSSAMCSSLESLPTTPSADDFPCFSGLDISHIHPAFQGLVTRCDKGLLYEVDELCTEFLSAFKEYYSEWLDTRVKEGGDPKTVGLDLSTAIRPQIAFLTQDGKWPLPSALGNLVRQLKKEISKLGKETNKPELLKDWIDCVLIDNFKTAYLAISGHLQNKLTVSRTIMTYSSYHVVETLFREHKEKNLSCCVVDPELNGRGLNLVKSLSKEGVKMIYTDLKSSAFAMQRCSMVLLGCSAVLSNGNVTSARGSLQLALTAKAFNVPVLVLSQSFKFVDKVQSSGRMALLRRDADEVVPADLITAVVTDIRILPPSSAPAVLKAKDIELR